MEALINFYVMMINKKSKTIENVPLIIRQEVQALLESEE